MAKTQPRTDAEIREQIAEERVALGEAIENLRDELVGMQGLRKNLPAIAAAAFIFGFVISGGVGASIRLVLRRVYERRTARLQLGRLRITGRLR